MKLSIIIPTFNNFQYLKFFLRSLKINSEFNHEIIGKNEKNQGCGRGLTHRHPSRSCPRYE